MDAPTSEKRRHPRVPLDSVTAWIYSEHGRPTAPEHCPVINVSLEGMLFKAKRLYEPGQLLMLTLRVPNDPGETKLHAAVVHCRQQEEDRWVGVQFKDSQDPAHETLRAYVRSALS